MSDDVSRDAIEAVVQDFVVAMLAADESLLRRCFHADCRIIGHFHDELEWLTLDDFIASLTAEGPQQEEPYCDIQQLDVSGDAASVKLIDMYAGMRFTDYLALLRHDGRWQIVNKLYYYHA
ncbi:nuclear transport factor 2 family protein [Pseudomonas paeninsulae]|uniref:nuclear transport factor 2 family protein n=1 Tax=Pseudomonas paeninsulae TaxID=3110772 RepID=UPI002D77FE78|nr:nuclear transport factor 2 family protein [Pseudomonas sp. IT1137]